jgi:glutaredoxin
METNIILFVQTGCGFCERVRAALTANDIPYTEKNIADPAVITELISLGGKQQVPFMVDGDTMMYESRSIIEHVLKTYTNPEITKKPRMHFAKSTEMCPSK